MKRFITLVAAILLCAASTAYALYSVANEGQWPQTWPKELDPLRKQSRTLVGPFLEYRHYAIPFTKREEFEAAWPHLLQAKTKGAPIVLRRVPSIWYGDGKDAGVCVHTPPEGQAPNTDLKVVNGNWEQAIYIELIVDGKIIDLNRVPLPDDTPIIDERFKDHASSQVKP